MDELQLEADAAFLCELVDGTPIADDYVQCISTSLLGVAQLTDDQKHLGQLIYGHFHERGSWPPVADLEHTEFKRRSRVDVRAALRSFPPTLGGYDNDNTFWLSARGIYAAAGEVEETADFLAAVRVAVQRYDDAGVTGELTPSDLVALGMDGDRANRVFKLIQHEWRIWTSLSGSSISDWRLRVNPEVRHFLDIADIASYEGKCAEMEKPAMYPVGVAMPPSTSLGLDFTEAGSMGAGHSSDANALALRPIFSSRDFDSEPDLVFVLMPFGAAWSNDSWAAIKEAAQRLGMHAMRADQMHGPVITEDIWLGILRARVVVADVTGWNPNVFYELGVTHTVGRDFVLISQDPSEKLPFDTQHFRHIRYVASADGLQKLTADLGPAITYFTKR